MPTFQLCPIFLDTSISRRNWPPNYSVLVMRCKQLHHHTSSRGNLIQNVFGSKCVLHSPRGRRQPMQNRCGRAHTGTSNKRRGHGGSVKCLNSNLHQFFKLVMYWNLVSIAQKNHIQNFRHKY
jgi:hypothetical protein